MTHQTHGGSAAQQRRRQRRPELQSAMALPSELCAAVGTTCQLLQSDTLRCGASETLDRTLSTICACLQSLRDVDLTADRQLQLLPRLTEALREGGVTAAGVEYAPVDDTGAARKSELLSVLLRTLVFPFLLDSRVRYLHRGLMNLLRAVYPSGLPPPLLATLREMYMATLVTCWPTHNGRPCLYPQHLAAVLAAPAVAPFSSSPALPADPEPYGESVLSFLNGVDGLGSTLMPYAPTVFAETFLAVLPLLADCLQWAVANAVARRRGDGAGAARDAVYGEDLEHVRFGVRVVATYTHRYTERLAAVWEAHGDGAAADPGAETAVAALARTLEAATFMLASELFPKDVLNATGLLVASALTVCTCEPRLLLRVCDGVCSGRRVDQAATRHTRRVVGADGPARVRAVTEVLCSADPVAALEAHPAAAAAVSDVFGSFSCNGMYAFFKGLLAHLSSPVRGDPRSVGVLLRPVPSAPAHDMTSSGEGGKVCPEAASVVSIALDRIAPLSQQGCAVVEEPEMRFMAIQTVDAIVRHVVAVFTVAVEYAESVPARAEGSSAEDAGALLTHFASICRPSHELQAFLDGATRLVMDLWDDSTQQMSGPLYETYDRVLRVNQLLARFLTHVRAAGVHTAAVDGHVLLTATSTRSVLAGVLHVQNERRGKYHGLLSLLGVMPLTEFVEVVAVHSGGEELRGQGVTPAAVPGVVALARMLLKGASNHKVANVAGDVFAKLTSLVSAAAAAAGDGSSSVYADMLASALLGSLARAIVEPGYTPAASNVSEAVSISNTVAHFAYPLLKQSREYLSLLISSLLRAAEEVASGGGAASEARLRQGIVEVLARARSCGMDTSAYLQPQTASFAVVRESLQSLHWDVRRAALSLCVQSTKKVEPVRGWQCALMETFLAANMNLGGDTTARRELATAFRQWIERVVDSAQSAEAAAAKAAAEASEDGATQRGELAAYVALTRAHTARLAQLLAANYGESAALARGYAVERRVAALTLYAQLLATVAAGGRAGRASRTALSDSDARALLLPSITEALVADLSDGWSLLRTLARDVLRLYTRHALPLTLQGLTADPHAADAARAEAAAAQTYRAAEGAVARYMLLRAHDRVDAGTDAVGAGAEGVYDELAVELTGLESLMTSLKSLLQQQQQQLVPQPTEPASEPAVSSRAAVYHWLQANPLHGRLSLAMELLDDAHARGSGGAQRGHTGAGRTSTANPTQPPPPPPRHVEACNRMLACCGDVIRLCGSLVGGTHNTERAEGGSGGAAAAVLARRDTEAVDCRGHVYDTTNPEAESVMRRVVNITWLGMRVATLAVHRVLKLAAVETLSLVQVRQVCFELVEGLLLTKHNGVMRCIRGALKSLTEALVRSRAAPFYRIPGETLSYLLGSEGVTSTDFFRMLRRSQGLPHAMLAVLEAEDPAAPFTLFPLAMAKLLSVARGDALDDDNAGSCRVALPVMGDNAETLRDSQRSNALNVLKFIFEDKVFADRSVTYLEEAFTLSTEGFHNRSWYIRNSSLMLFSSVLPRFVGEHPATGGAGVNTSLHDIAMRTPRGLAFALRTLHAGGKGADGLVGHGRRTSSPSSASAGGCDAESDPNAHMALFPVLQLLSMLAPDPPHRVSHAAGAAASNSVAPVGSGDAAAMIAAVRRCALSPHLMIRSASAVALSCLVAADAACETIGRVADEQLTWQGRQGPPPGLNTIHGTVLELLQFHTVYVGTLRRNRRLHRLSGYATPALAAAVGGATQRAIAHHAAVLRRACEVSPTIAAALLTLLHDHLCLGYLADVAAAATSSAAEAAVEARWDTAVFAMTLVEMVATTYTASSAGAPRGADVGHAREAAALVLAVCARLVALAPGSTDDADSRVGEVRRCIGRTIEHEVATLDLLAGAHNLVSCLLDHLLYYCSPTRSSIVGLAVAFFTDARAANEEGEGAASVASTATAAERGALALVHVVEACCCCCSRSGGSERGSASQSLRTASLAALGRLLTHQGGCGGLGCVAWAEVVAHLEFAVVLAAVRDPTTEDAHVALQSALAACMGLSAPGSGRLLANTDAQGAALRYLARRAALESTVAVSTASLVSLLHTYARPERPVACREAVVTALGDLLAPLSAQMVVAGTTATALMSERRTVGLLVTVLLQLIFDDLTAVREAACAVCARFFAEGGADERSRRHAARDVTSSALSIVLFLRALGPDVVSVADVRQYLASDADTAAESGDGDGNSDGGQADEEESDDEEVLFAKEADNMFMEDSLMAYLMSKLADPSDDREGTAPDRCPHLACLDQLLEAAEAAKSFVPAMGVIGTPGAPAHTGVTP